MRFHLVAQAMLRAQLGGLRERLDAADFRLGLDLAVGVHPDGYDAWSRQALFAAGVSVGAPRSRLPERPGLGLRAAASRGIAARGAWVSGRLDPAPDGAGGCAARGPCHGVDAALLDSPGNGARPGHVRRLSGRGALRGADAGIAPPSLRGRRREPRHGAARHRRGVAAAPDLGDVPGAVRGDVAEADRGTNGR
ncbi:MAG: 4-alpha-glucanotransferase [Gemmatimonadetes bacterium]|nr:4-alpha-glucanotransferase [Gemmatimonadota bacterium]